MKELAKDMMMGSIAWWLLLAALAGIAVLWNLYLKEKRKTAKFRGWAKGEKSFYQAFEEEKSGFYIYITKEGREVSYISPNFRKMTGLEEEFVKADLEVLKELVSPQMKRKIPKEIDKWDKKGILKLETPYHRIHSETEKYARIRITETETGYLLSCMDMTEDFKVREQMQKELAAAQKESSAKTDFLLQMSHEIRTPMNGIMGMLSLAKAHLNDRQGLEEYLSKTESLSQFLLTLINDILDMSRIESGKMELEKVPFDLFALAENLDNMFCSTAESKGIHWSVELQDFDERYVVGDEMRLSQVIINFISNANKFTPAGGSVTVTFRQMDKIDQKLHLMIRVRDTGKGIRRDFVDKIFRPFEQEDASTGETETPPTKDNTETEETSNWADDQLKPKDQVVTEYGVLTGLSGEQFPGYGFKAAVKCRRLRDIKKYFYGDLCEKQQFHRSFRDAQHHDRTAWKCIPA